MAVFLLTIHFKPFRKKNHSSLIKLFNETHKNNIVFGATEHKQSREGERRECANTCSMYESHVSRNAIFRRGIKILDKTQW
jgi:hypothetical protein